MEIKGVILAGGRSKRFGEDKRFFKINEKTLVEIAIHKIKAIFKDIYIVCDDKGFLREKLNKIYPFDDINLVEDIEKYKGPLNGIYSFFKRTKEKSAFFYPYDMLYFPLKFIGYLKDLALKFDFKKIILISIERPLPCFIPSLFFIKIEEYLKEGSSIKGFINSLKEEYEDKIYFIPDKELLKFGNPEHYLKNINKKDDLKYAGRLL